MPTIVVRFYGPARDLVGEPSITLDIANGETVAAVAQRLEKRYPHFREARGIRLAVNRAYVPTDHCLVDGDEVAVIPPVSGGATTPRVALVREAIDADRLVKDMSDPRAGAVATFSGTVRCETCGDKILAALDYEAYDEMAIRQLTAIRGRAVDRFDILDAAVIHGLGRVPLGEVSILVVVAAAHRGPAFDACRFIVDAVKADAPIWKKDVWTDGSVAWVDPL
ncbi:MAG: molybdenum cofactor biosynthesis protein MoaE [Phycisphaerae bacterium]